MSLIRNERTKLAAAALDRLSGVCVAIGVAAPVAAWLCGAGGGDWLTWAVASGGWLAVGGGLHLLARRTLGRLGP